MYKLSKADREFIDQHRGVYDPQVRWYAAMTHWGRERAVVQRIGKQLAGHYEEILLPELAAEAGEKHGRLLFGGYLFLRCRMTDEIYLAVTAEPQIFKVFGKAFRIPEPIDEREMEVFRSVLTAEPKPQMVTRSQVGQQVLVIEGLMRGLCGRVVGVNAQHVKIETGFSFLDQGSGVVVCVPHAQVRVEEPAEDATALAHNEHSEAKR